MMMNAASGLRQLYRSARRMAVSNDIDELLECLLEDLRCSTGFERVLLLRLELKDLTLVVEKCYGFENLIVPFDLSFTAEGGLLQQVYTDRAPLNIVHSMNGDPVKFSSDFTSAKNNRRQSVKLCVSSTDVSQSDLQKRLNSENCSTVLPGGYDPDIATLLGTVESFLLLPICDKSNFYGFLIADKSVSAESISYDEVRQSCALANHSANALCRAHEHKRMLKKITNQLTEIEKLESFSQSIIQNLRSGLIILNQLMNITEVNKAAEIALGYSEDELLGKPIDYLLENENNGRECLFLDEEDALDSVMGLLAETGMHKKNGKTFPAEICYSVITDQNDDIQGLSCIFRDITARKAMERDLARVDKLSSLGELAAGVAHEIKNPLAGIAGAIQVISRSYGEECQHRYIFNEVLSQVNRLDSFVDGLLQFARPGQTNFREVDIARVLQKALLIATSQEDCEKIVVSTKFREKQPPIQGDADQLQQVFLNILINAMDAMESGGTISIATNWNFRTSAHCSSSEVQCNNPGCQSAVGELLVSFTDNGKGIAKDSLEKIFNPFHTTKSNGTGLGLSISHRIVEQHGGTISVESIPEESTTFYVHLPICTANQYVSRVSVALN